MIEFEDDETISDGDEMVIDENEEVCRPFGTGVTIKSLPRAPGDNDVGQENFEVDIDEKFIKHLEHWQKEDACLVSELRCCGYCGHVELGGKNLSATNGFTRKAPPTSYPQSAFPSPRPPAGLANSHLLHRMTIDDGSTWLCCSRCKSNLTRAKRMKHLVHMNQYMGSVPFFAVEK